jgi:hypothetical protein
LSSWKSPCQDVLRLPIVPCTSAIHALVAFSVGHHSAYNFLVKSTCCYFAQPIGVTSDPRITFPYLLKICASTFGLCALQASASASRSKSCRARGTVVGPSLAISSIGAFRTPAVGARGKGRLQASENLHNSRRASRQPRPRSRGAPAARRMPHHLECDHGKRHAYQELVDADVATVVRHKPAIGRAFSSPPGQFVA